MRAAPSRLYAPFEDYTMAEVAKSGRSCKRADYSCLYEYDLGDYYTLDIRFPIWKLFAEKLNVCLLSVEHRL